MRTRDGNNESKDERQRTRDLKTWRNTLCLNRDTDSDGKRNKETETLRQNDRRMYRDRKESWYKEIMTFTKMQ